MLRLMGPGDATEAARKERLARERRLQTGAALVLGLLVLTAMVLRAGVRNVFASGWWRH